MKARNLSFVTALTVLVAAASATAEPATIVNVRNFRSGEVYCKAIEVARATTIHIDVVGAGDENQDRMWAYAWIVPSGKLDPVWVMEWDRTEEFGSEEWLRRYDSNLELEPGRYEIYYYAGLVKSFGGFVIDFDWDKLKESIKKLKKNETKFEQELQALARELGKDMSSSVVVSMNKAAEKQLKEYYLEIEGDNAAIRISTCDYSSKLSVAEILRPDHDQYTSVGFTVDKPIEVEIQAIGEILGWDDTFADYGWIINADSRRRVWSMENTRREWAGGAEKNQKSRRQLRLEPGDYLLYYVTDDSHSYDDWNAAPPYNPEAYGVRVSVINERDKASVRPYKESQSQMPMLSIVRVGDDFQEVKPFRVTRDCQVRVYAIGECNPGSSEFADYAWIEREGDDEPIWLMLENNTEPAGGAKKNRLADEVITLRKGDYLLGYVTDDSHSYGDWNATPPYDQKNYGVSLFAAINGGSQPPIVELAEETESGDVLARVIRVGDDADETASFSLDQPTRVHIYALGEGLGNEMHDYGWIENSENGDIVWEMTYRRTKHAGGAEKNRKADTEILLDKGRYRVHYVSDGSHAFGSWNAEKPRNPQRWGITVSRAQ